MDLFYNKGCVSSRLIDCYRLLKIVLRELVLKRFNFEEKP